MEVTNNKTRAKVWAAFRRRLASRRLFKWGSGERTEESSVNRQQVASGHEGVTGRSKARGDPRQGPDRALSCLID
jgi:hypothetical protein